LGERVSQGSGVSLICRNVCAVVNPQGEKTIPRRDAKTKGEKDILSEMIVGNI